MLKFIYIFLILFFSAIPFCEAAHRQPKPKLVLFTGCARSGTLFMSKFLQMNGVNIKHENEGLDGSVSWLMAVDDYNTPWGPGASHFKFKHTFHQVRHPLKAIASISNEPPPSWKYICKHIRRIRVNEPALVKAAKYWIYWNLRAEKKSEFTYRLEDLPAVLPILSAVIGKKLDPALLSEVPKDFYNNRNYQNTCSWSDLKAALEPQVYRTLLELADRYGYDVSEAP